MDLRSKAYAILNTMQTVASVPQTTTQVIDPDKELRETMTELMTNALKSGDMETYKMLKAERDALRAPEVVTISATGASVEQPKFEVSDSASIDDTDLAKELSGVSTPAENKNDEPLVFDIESAGNKPSWDGVQANA